MMMIIITNNNDDDGDDNNNNDSNNDNDDNNNNDNDRDGNRWEFYGSVQFSVLFYGSVLSWFNKRFINHKCHFLDTKLCNGMRGWTCLNWKVLESSYILAPWPLSLRSEGFWA